MKIFQYASLFILIISCSQKSTSKNTFRLILGHSAISASGGAYVDVIDAKSLKSTLYKLDSDNAAVIPYGTYTLLSVAFAGPGENSGVMSCGMIESATFNSPDSTLNISISVANCQQPVYAKTISTILNKNASQWGLSLWDSSLWGP